MLFPGAETNPSVDHSKYVQKLKSLSGNSNSFCPDLLIPLRGQGSSECLRKALASNNPFWLSMRFYPFGNYEVTWVGLARNKKGQLWYVIFDPDRTGGWSQPKSPYLAASECHGIIIPSEIREPLRCTNWR
jgi:hypothetical protein